MTTPPPCRARITPPREDPRATRMGGTGNRLLRPATAALRHSLTRMLTWMLLAPLLAARVASAAEPPTYADLQPLLQQRCVMCHSSAAPAAGLALDSLAGLRKGATRGPVVVAGQGAASELVKRLKGQSLPRMPMTGPPWVDDADIARIERWVNAGLPAGAPAAAATAPQPAAPAPGQPVTWAHVAPVLAAHCARCHTVQGQMGPAPEGYLLTSYEGAVSAADRVRVVPGRPEASELMRRILGHAQPRMPYRGPPWLSAEHTRLVERWIADGARDASGRPAPMPVGARIRLRGVMSADGTLNGLALPAGGRPDKLPRPGDAMELRGSLLPDGGIALERLRQR